MKAKRIIGLILMIIGAVILGILTLTVIVAGIPDPEFVVGVLVISVVFAGMLVLGIKLRYPRVHTDKKSETRNVVINGNVYVNRYDKEKMEIVVEPVKAAKPEIIGPAKLETDGREKPKMIEPAKPETVEQTIPEIIKPEPKIDEETEARLAAYIKENCYPTDKIAAIKYCRQQTNCDLGTAKRIVYATWGKAELEKEAAGKNGTDAANKKEMPAVITPDEEIDEETKERLVTYVTENYYPENKIRAIAYFRQYANCGLKMAREIVEDAWSKEEAKRIREEKGLNDEIRDVIKRMVQTVRENTDENQEAAGKYWNQLCKMIPETLFFVPINYDNEAPFGKVDDVEIHVFPEAAKQIEKLQENGVCMWMVGHPFAQKADSRKMHLRVLIGRSGEIKLACYTHVSEIERTWSGISHLALATFDDMIRDYAPASGIIINHASQGLVLNKNEIDEIVRKRNEQTSAMHCG